LFYVSLSSDDQDEAHDDSGEDLFCPHGQQWSDEGDILIDQSQYCGTGTVFNWNHINKRKAESFIDYFMFPRQVL